MYPNKLLVMLGDFNEFYDQDSVFGDLKRTGLSSKQNLYLKEAKQVM